jgi:hypothetical protein
MGAWRRQSCLPRRHPVGARRLAIFVAQALLPNAAYFSWSTPICINRGADLQVRAGPPGPAVAIESKSCEGKSRQGPRLRTRGPPHKSSEVILCSKTMRHWPLWLRRPLRSPCGARFSVLAWTASSTRRVCPFRLARPGGHRFQNLFPPAISIACRKLPCRPATPPCHTEVEKGLSVHRRPPMEKRCAAFIVSGRVLTTARPAGGTGLRSP